MRLAVVGFVGLFACAGPSRSTMPANDAIPAPTTASEPVVVQLDEVALGDTADPCEGGEVTGVGGGGGGTIGDGKGTAGPGMVGKPAVKDSEPPVSSSVDRSGIVRILKANRNSMRYCYEKRLLIDPKLEGTVRAKFTIERAGTVIDATATGLDPDVDACIAAKLKTLRFPAQDSNITISYPYVFTLEK